MDVRRDLDLHICSGKSLAQLLGTVARTVVQLAEGDGRLGPSMEDVRGPGDKADDTAESPQDLLGPEDRRELCRRLNPVLEGDDKGFRSDQGSHGLSCVRDLPGLHPHQDRIHRADMYRIVGRLRGVHHEITLQALDVEAPVS